jgi:putative methionine-R-sulfoxide reductase with GAF domain
MRDYEGIAERITPGTDRTAAMQDVVDRLWDALSSQGVSWVGFYTKDPNDDSMLLGPRRDKPACSPIGLHGACGQCYSRKQPMVVRDVADLGADYIACDPRDRSEVVIPLLEPDGGCWGVLDLDSFEVGAFGDRDVAGLALVLSAAGFLVPDA